MQLTKQLEAEIKEVMNDYWNSYFEGKLDHWANYLVEDYRNIGGTEEEIWNSKTEILDYTKRIINQMQGTTELRNKQTQIIPYDPYIMVHELLDIYIKVEGEWTFYQKFRLSSLIQKTADGWKVLHQHGSYPDSKTTEGEAFAFDTLKSENSRLQKAISERTVELENKNRELQIEAAMERVRARSMAMRHSDELADTASVLFQQIKELGFQTWSCGFCTWQKNDLVEVWMAADSGGLLPPMMIPGKKEPTHKKIYEASLTGETAHDKIWEGAALQEHYEFLKTIPSVKEAIDILEKSGLSLPERQCYYVGFFNQGYLLLITKEPNDELKDLSKRFAKVFEQTYTRFLDLQKAEAQAREAQIETALEKVRSSSLAMRKSDELNEIVSVVFEKLKELQIPVTAVGIGIYIDDSKDLNGYVCGENKDGLVINNYRLPYFHNKISDDFNNAREKQLDFFVGNYSKEEKNSFYEYLFEHVAEIRQLPEDMKSMIFESPQYTITMVAVNNATFNINDFEGKTLSEKEVDIIKRFAKVFDQSYTRFLDLQKAEAQAREAQIETGLERVRSRTMGMQKSEELKEVIKIVYEQLRYLKINLAHAGFVVDYMPGGDWHFWIADEQDIPSKITHPYFESVWANQFNEAKEKSTDFFTTHLNFEEKNRFYNELLTYIPGLPEASKSFYLGCPGLAASTVLFDNVSLYIENFLGIPYRDQENKILMRFGKVFQQTYTRFLDLQKAEAQAREAMIEASLEKVRSVALSLKNSEDMLDIAQVLYEQLLILGFTQIRNAIIDIHNDEDKTFMDYDYSHEMSGTVTRMSYYDDPIIEEQVKQIESSSDAFFELILEGKELQNLIDIRTKNGEKEDPRLSQIEQLSYNLYSFGNGAIGISNFGLLTSEQKLVLKRFRNVFTFAYKRYNDLAQAEQLARRAQIDLEHLIVAKKKADDALAELKSTQTQLIQSEKMASLGELTAGIAHEIQNPLNFVNNFSEVNTELIDEMKVEMDKGNIDDAKAIANDIKENEQKINHHGKRADAIVKGMLQHSRSSSGLKESTDINALADEYLRLAYHGLRAKDKSFNATMKTDYDESIGNINIIPQDIGRVILNLITNAFYVVDEKKKSGLENYEPTVSVSTKKNNGKVEIKVADNGNGIRQKVLDKIFQPFFTTKPTGQGTGLGLSLSYDIVKAHGGELKVETKEGEGSMFIILIPAN